MLKKIILSLFIGFSTVVFAQNSKFSKLDSLFQKLEENNKFMGTVSLAKDGDIIYSKSIGYADIERKTKNSAKTKYKIGSISKMFTSVLIFKAIEENKIELNTTIATYFPNLPESKNITISNLLNHRSGLHNFTNESDYLEWNTKHFSQEDLIEMISSYPREFKVDSKAEYSNSNYVLLAIILEKIYNDSYENLLNKNIVNPLNLKNTSLAKEIEIDNKEANSYSYEGEWKKENETNMSIPIGAGDILSNNIDLTQFITALFDYKIINETSLNKMIELEDGYGRGIFSMPFYEKVSYGHTGGIDGFSSMLTYIPEDKIAFSLTSNGSNFNNNNIAIATLSSYYDKEFELPTFNSIELEPKDLDQYLGEYSSEQIPIKISITKKGNVLFGQATGQPSFALEAVSEHLFSFDQASLKLKFMPEENKMILIQRGEFIFTKEQ